MICRWFSTLNPEPWTSPSVSVGRKNGKPFPRVYKNAKLRNYQEAVKEELEAALQLERPVVEPIALRFLFSRDTTGGQPVDATNLQKSLEDALQGILFKNDSQVIQVSSSIVNQGRGVLSWIGVEMDTEVDPALVNQREIRLWDWCNKNKGSTHNAFERWNL